MVLTFKEMTDSPIRTGLCGKCDIIPCSSHSAYYGCVMCEGVLCKDAFQTYLKEKFDDPCNHCKNREQDTMGKVAACNCCEQYEFFSPNDKDVE